MRQLRLAVAHAAGARVRYLRRAAAPSGRSECRLPALRAYAEVGMRHSAIRPLRGLGPVIRCPWREGPEWAEIS